MKLLCINAKVIITNMPNNEGIYKNLANGLKEGEVYETNGEVYIGQYKQSCYYIDGVGERLACRFIKALEDTKEELIWSKKEELCLN